MVIVLGSDESQEVSHSHVVFVFRFETLGLQITLKRQKIIDIQIFFYKTQQM